jgi:phytoene desaturase
MTKTGIIGAGIAGIATAVRLASKGQEVHVFETNSYPGGKLTSFENNGFRFDAGPSLFTMPAYVEELFQAAGEQARDHFYYETLDTACHYFWDDGTFLKAYTSEVAFAKEVQQVLGIPAERLLSYLKKSERKYRLAGRIFLEKSLHKASTWLSPDVLKAALRLPFFDIFSSMHDVNQNWFRQEKIVQLFDRYATYNGSDPYKAPGMLTIIPHFEHGIGTFYPRGGMQQITNALYELALRKGATFHFNSPVTKILVSAGRATGLQANSQTWHFDRIVSNMDVFFTYHRLMPEQPRPERVLRQPKSTSALIFYWGIKAEFPELHLHNIFFSNDYRREFSLLGEGKVSEDPTVYVNITSKYTPEDAPPGCENWFVMVNTPCDQGQDWNSLIPQIRNSVIQKLSRRLGRDLSALIASEDLLDPAAIQQRTSSHLGALYGYSSNNMMAAFLRHPNFSSAIKDLYFVGGSVHPGGGIPLCLLSAKITAENITQA